MRVPRRCRRPTSCRWDDDYDDNIDNHDVDVVDDDDWEDDDDDDDAAADVDGDGLNRKCSFFLPARSTLQGAARRGGALRAG